MRKIFLAGVTLLLLTGNALAQPESPYCLWNKEMIGRVQKSLNGVRQLLGTDAFAVLECTPKQNETLEMARDRCDSMSDSFGTWRDNETNKTWVILTKSFIENFAYAHDPDPKLVAHLFARSEAVKSKIALSGVVATLEMELQRWQEHYQEHCVFEPQEQRPRPPCATSGLGLLCVDPPRRGP